MVQHQPLVVVAMPMLMVKVEVVAQEVVQMGLVVMEPGLALAKAMVRVA